MIDERPTTVAVDAVPAGIPGTSFASRRFHLVGVGGSGMSGLARLLAGSGGIVTGSDASGGVITDALAAEGHEVWIGCQPARVVGQDGYVIRSAAVPIGDAEVQECVRRGFTSLLYAEAVGRLSEGRRSLAIAGTHGKTTTTGLAVSALRGAGLDPSHLIGGEAPQLGGNGHGGQSPEFVVEACEFNRSFHNLRPFGAAILNVDQSRRHRTGQESVPKAVLNSLRNDVRILTVGSGLWADIRAVEVSEHLGQFSFVPVLLGRRLERVQLSLSGRHNMQNALFALGLAHVAGADLAGASRGIAAFTGVRRRFELHTGPRGGLLVNDYAHHPAEIRAVLQTARRRFPGRRLLVVFQPHQFQRTLCLLSEFAVALSAADHVLLVDIYGARESAEMKAAVSSADLAQAVRDLGCPCAAVGAVAAVPDAVRAARTNDQLVLVLGAGDVDQAVGGIVAGL